MSDAAVDLPEELKAFLGDATPAEWVAEALRQPEVLLLDHASCELKAASTALSLMFRYPRHQKLVHRMSRLAREELRHFEQVRALMEKRGTADRPLTASRYAAGLRKLVRKTEPGALVDMLITGAFIEARSAERFAALAPRLDKELGRFYAGLLAAEARHFEQYLGLAVEYHAGTEAELQQRIAAFRDAEAALCCDPDPQFRFHSGTPVMQEGLQAR
ncbi:MAG: tRNA-(ms[2]io[6]A)-hydroxylase [Gammaproteobacteria bacterium]